MTETNQCTLTTPSAEVLATRGSDAPPRSLPFLSGRCFNVSVLTAHYEKESRLATLNTRTEGGTDNAITKMHNWLEDGVSAASARLCLNHPVAYGKSPRAADSLRIYASHVRSQTCTGWSVVVFSYPTRRVGAGMSWYMSLFSSTMFKISKMISSLRWSCTSRQDAVSSTRHSFRHCEPYC